MQILPLFEFSHFEVVLAQIVTVLVAEEANQQAQAVLQAKDPSDFSWTTVSEEFYNIRPVDKLEIPLVNVWFDTTDLLESGNLKTTVRGDFVYNIDVYSKANTSSDGETQGLTVASLQLHRVIRQVFLILMSPKYHFNLGLDIKDMNGDLIKFIEKIRFNNISKFQPVNSADSKENIIAARMTLAVQMIENVADLTGDPLEEFLATMDINDNGTDSYSILIDGGN